MFFLNRPSHTLAYSSLFKSRCLLRRIVQYFLLHRYVFDASCNPARSTHRRPLYEQRRLSAHAGTGAADKRDAAIHAAMTTRTTSLRISPRQVA